MWVRHRSTNSPTCITSQQLGLSRISKGLSLDSSAPSFCWSWRCLDVELMTFDDKFLLLLVTSCWPRWPCWRSRWFRSRRSEDGSGITTLQELDLKSAEQFLGEAQCGIECELFTYQLVQQSQRKDTKINKDQHRSTKQSRNVQRQKTNWQVTCLASEERNYKEHVDKSYVLDVTADSSVLHRLRD